MVQLNGQPIWFLSATRTPFGTFLGKIAHLSATDLGVYASQHAIKNAHIEPQDIDQVVYGNVSQTSKDAIYLARHIGLRAGLKEDAPALTINRLCGSGFEAVVQGARLIKTEEADCVLVGGSESMSQAPHIIRGARLGLALGRSELEDSLMCSLTDTYVNLPMAMTGENLAEKYGISQEEVDGFSCQSQMNYKKALEENVFEKEITPLNITIGKQSMLMHEDEHPRPNTTLDVLKKLPKVFKKDGVIHAGAASGIADGASSLIMCSDRFLKQRKLTPLGEFLGFGVSGCDPKIMGIGPVMATKKALSSLNLSLQDLSMVEINEAFAPQVLAVTKELELNPKAINIHGGAIALGHPLAASGARITTHLLHSLRGQTNKIGLGSACIGGGQGISVIIRSI